MKNDILVDAIGLIDDEMVKDAKEGQKKILHISFMKKVLLPIAVVLCLIASVPILTAADVEAAYQLLYTISPAMAQRFKPIQKSCIDNGIQMEVVATHVYDDTAEIYIAMKDLEGNRIDETTDLFDSCDISGIYDNYGTCSLQSYDEETGVATFLISITQMNDVKFRSDKITFSVTKFLSHKKISKSLLSEIDLSAVSSMPETQTDIHIQGIDPALLGTEITVLKPQLQPLLEPTNGVCITAIGYIDNLLHIQIRYENISETDNHGWVWLQDSYGNIIDTTSDISFRDENNPDIYYEYFFDVPYDEIGNYQISGEFTTCEHLVRGDWQVTFPIEDTQ